MEQSIPKKLGMFALLTAGSLFAQTLLWVAYDYFQMQVWVMGALPLLICLLYHAVQLDSGADKLMGRRFVRPCLRCCSPCSGRRWACGCTGSIRGWRCSAVPAGAAA